MAITSINRGLITRSVTADYSAQVDDDQIFVDASGGAVTVTLYEPVGDGAKHQLEVIKTDNSANAVTITDGTLSVSLSTQNDSMILEQQYSGAWFVASDFSTTSAASASSQATSAGLAASAAGSTATSQNTSQSANISQVGSTATSQNDSQSIIISVVQSTANSG